MRKPTRVGLDLDGVIIDHTANKLKLAKGYGYALEPWQANTNVMKRFMERDHYESLQGELYTIMTLEAPPVAGCLERLPELAGSSEIYIVSARSSDSVRHAQAWLMKHRLFDLIPAERIFFCNDSKDKRGICDRLLVDVFLDDKLSVLASLPEKVKRVLFDPDDVARMLEMDSGIGVVSAWAEFCGMAAAR
jgi:uncharacterized HAD superfamily protein